MDRIPLNRYLIYAVAVVSGLAADLATKSYMFSWPALRANQTYWIWPEHFGFQLSLNEGALFGMGQGLVALFALLAIAAAIAIPTWLFWFGAAWDLWLTLALGGVTAGILGNLYDRLGLPGLIWQNSGARAGEPVYAVRDWILFQINPQWTWPNFNIADSLLVIGAAILFMRAMKQGDGNGSDPHPGGN